MLVADVLNWVDRVELAIFSHRCQPPSSFEYRRGLFDRYLKDYDYYQKCLAEQDRENKPTLKRNRNQSGCLCFSGSSKTRREGNNGGNGGGGGGGTTSTTSNETPADRPLFDASTESGEQAVWQEPSGLSRSVRFILILPVLMVFICTIFTILILLQIYT